MLHKPVLLNETIELLNLKEGNIVVDGTLGSGGHAAAILEKIGPYGRLIGLDQDPAALERNRAGIGAQKNVSLHHKNFRDLQEVLDSLNVPQVDAVILDVGFSSDQLEDADRGFSFNRPGPLDMRMDPENPVTAQELVNRLPEKELERVLLEFGEEHRAKKIAAEIARERRKHEIITTDDLSAVVFRAFGLRPPRPGQASGFRRHPATQVFQALRIAVNDELGALQTGLAKCWERIKAGGRFAVITFHSLEDRIVKQQFRAWQLEKAGRPVNKKAVQAQRQEVLTNPRSRSAKLRVMEKAA